MSDVLADVKGFGKLKSGKGDADIRAFCAKKDGEVEILTLTPQRGGVKFTLKVKFSNVYSACAASEEYIAEWRIHEDILPEVFSSFKIREESFKEL